jgi:hypothetical protein
MSIQSNLWGNSGSTSGSGCGEKDLAVILPIYRKDFQCPEPECQTISDGWAMMGILADGNGTDLGNLSII